MNITSPVSTATPRLPEYTIPGKGKIIVTEELEKQIKYLHNKVGSIEWSGLLFYTKVAGTLDNPESLIIRAEDIFLMDIGSSAYTSANISSEDMIAMMEQIPGAEEGKQYGLIHTHHSMTTFFSGTDVDELHQNVKNHNYYVSLIVNFSGVYAAKVVFVGEVTTGFRFKDADEEVKAVNTSKEVMFIIDLNIEREVNEEVPDYVLTRFQELKQKREEEYKTRAQSSNYGDRSNTIYPAGVPGVQPRYGSVGPRGSEPYKGSSAGFVSTGRGRSYFDEGTDEENDAWDRFNNPGKYLDDSPGDSQFEKEIHQRTREAQQPLKSTTILTPSASEVAKIGRVRNPAGKIIEMRDNDARSLCIEILDKALRIVGAPKVNKDLVQHGFMTLGEAVSCFDTIFKLKTDKGKKRSGEYEYFLDQLQKVIREECDDYSPNLIEKKLPQVISEHSDVLFARDFSTLCAAHGMFDATMKQHERNNCYL